jgi:hypothetical protein
MGWAYRGATRVVALDEDMAERVRSYGVEPAIVPPWVFDSALAQPLPTLAPNEPWTWIYSGNLGRAHEWQTLLEAQALLEKCDAKITLVFQGGGPAWPAAQERAPGSRIERLPVVALREGGGFARGAAPCASLRSNAIARCARLLVAQQTRFRANAAAPDRLGRPDRRRDRT